MLCFILICVKGESLHSEQQTFIIVVQKAEVFAIDGICKKFEKTHLPEERLNQGKGGLPTFTQIASSGLAKLPFQTL